ncbi:MAG: quinone oxidoreductase [Rhodospirillales bacterium]
MTETIKAVRIHQTGGPEVLSYEDVEIGAPGPGQVRVRHSAIGLNFIDVYHRTGLYPLGDLPAMIGLEGAGTIVAAGPGVEGLEEGGRVAYASPPAGAYAEERIIAADRLIKLPDGIDERTAAAMMLKGLTAHYLIRRTYEVKEGDAILIHAAAGGVGLLVCQWAKHIGATVIGTVGTKEKATLAAANGCDHPIEYSRENFTERVREITGGEGVSVVYDSIGKDTFEGSLDCLRPMGMMVSFGNASGPVPAFEPAMLAARGSLFFTRPSLMHYTAKAGDLQAGARELMEVVGAGHVRVSVNQTYALKDAAKAHEDLEARKTTGSTLLIP